MDKKLAELTDEYVTIRFSARTALEVGCSVTEKVKVYDVGPNGIIASRDSKLELYPWHTIQKLTLTEEWSSQ